MRVSDPDLWLPRCPDPRTSGRSTSHGARPPSPARAADFSDLVLAAHAQVGCSANALGAHSSDHPRYGTIRNDTIYPEIVELSAWEWSLCARDLSDGPHRLGGLEPRPRLVCTPTRRMGSSVQRKRVDARPMRPCRSLESDGIEHRSVRKKSLYLAVSPDMNRTPESGQAVDRPRHR